MGITSRLSELYLFSDDLVEICFCRIYYIVAYVVVRLSRLVFSDVVFLDLEYKSEATVCVDEPVFFKVCDCVEL